MSEKFLIPLADYIVAEEQLVRDGEKFVTKVVEVAVHPKRDMDAFLRAPAILQNGMEVCDAVCLARQIKSMDGTDLVVDKKDLMLIQKIFNALISRPHNPSAGQFSLSGPMWEELILRVFKPQKVD